MSKKSTQLCHGKLDGSILIKDIGFLVTSKSRDEVLKGQSILIAGNRIKYIGSKNNWRVSKVINGQGKIVLPGFINTHHHLFQTFLRHVPELQNQTIDKWISRVSQLAKQMNPEAHYHAALTGMSELLFSGCTTTTDMLYFFPRSFDHEDIFEAYVRAATDLGIRFHPFRGSMSLSKKDNALFDNDVVESSKLIIQNTKKILEKFHDSADDAMVKVGVAPCTLFTNTLEDYQNAALLAKMFDVNLQTHVSESAYEQKYVKQQYKKTPLKLLQSLGWDDDRVSLAHCVEVETADIEQIAKRHNSVCHCPISNARSPIGQKGIAPIWEMQQKNVNISIGVDGSAGNDSANMLEEMRWARTMQGARPESTYLNAMDVLQMGTIGGARALRWQKSIGSIEVGKCADLAFFSIENSLAHVGAWDKVGSLISCQAMRADTVIVNGKIVIQDGVLLTANEGKIVRDAQKQWEKTFIYQRK